MNKVLLTILTLAIVAGTAVISYAALQVVTLKKTEVAHQAEFQCAMTMRYQVTQEDTTISYPAQELYETCLQEKGIR